jgi:type IV pilus assembly protein PilF
VITTTRLSGTGSGWLVAVLSMVLLAGCVTTTDSRFAREADKRKIVENYIQLATAYIGQNNLDRARFHLERATKLAPENPKVLATRGLILQAEGEAELAERSFREAIENDEGYTRGRVYYGAFLFGRGRFEEARVQSSAASRDTDYKDRASVFYNLGRTYEELEQPAEAATAYRRSLDLSRGNTEAILALSRALANSGNYTEAFRYYSYLMDLMDKNPNLRHSAQSLITGIRIAYHLGDQNRVSSLGLLLKSDFPDSLEYQQYKVLIADGQ